MALMKILGAEQVTHHDADKMTCRDGLISSVHDYFQLNGTLIAIAHVDGKAWAWGQRDWPPIWQRVKLSTGCGICPVADPD